MALISGVLMGAATVDAQARPPNVTDIALCNQQAQASTEREKPAVPDDARGGVLAATPPVEQAISPRYSISHLHGHSTEVPRLSDGRPARASLRSGESR